MLESLHKANLNVFLHLCISPGAVVHFSRYLFMYIYGVFFPFASDMLNASS